MEQLLSNHKHASLGVFLSDTLAEQGHLALPAPLVRLEQLEPSGMSLQDQVETPAL